MPTLAKNDLRTDTLRIHSIYTSFSPSIAHPRCCAATTWSTSSMTGNSSLGTPMRRWAAPKPLPSPPIRGYPCPPPYLPLPCFSAGRLLHGVLLVSASKIDSSQLLGRSPPSPWATDAVIHYPMTIGEPSDYCFNMIGLFLRTRNPESLTIQQGSGKFSTSGALESWHNAAQLLQSTLLGVLGPRPDWNHTVQFPLRQSRLRRWLVKWFPRSICMSYAPEFEIDCKHSVTSTVPVCAGSAYSHSADRVDGPQDLCVFSAVTVSKSDLDTQSDARHTASQRVHGLHLSHTDCITRTPVGCCLRCPPLHLPLFAGLDLGMDALQSQNPKRASQPSRGC
ncbi:hypothetical protein BDP55DRAFT_32460 [Colletotrichum godetiae]|uniref:Uncharacterized protein n=1 Tax=Colletotrichum godetiae TaxID=1209918 RepID=A0AAJ0F0V6_9PEZI|nr:uncharacterized protein BDP55DRAFT_32460 [Colletotrichum godetiae]KAK1688857.1 hypothetical protein BDP55DRAFT_32460 [Colletotrichum godetiae]